MEKTYFVGAGIPEREVSAVRGEDCPACRLATTLGPRHIAGSPGTACDRACGIIEKHITTGASVDQKEPIFRIADLQNVWVIASVYEKDIARMKKGQSASVRTKAHADSVFEGKITWVADTMDERTRTLKVRIEVDNTKRLLKPGMFVRANVVVDAKEDVISVPAAAVRRQGGETIVFVDEGGGRFERREVEIGSQAGGRVEVRKGLKSGERVVAEGSFILKSELEKEGFGGGHGH